MRVRIDVTVFSSPTTAFGNATGEVQINEAPQVNAPFPWPPAWAAAWPSYFVPEQSRISDVREESGQCLVSLLGIVCKSVAEAKDCAAFLEHEGLFFDYHDGESRHVA
jgi:hypothetical protein